MLYRRILKAERLTHVDSFWVAPNGDLYNVPWCNHSRFALTRDNTVDGLETAGWIHVSSDNIYVRRKPTAKQWAKMELWAKMRDKNFARVVDEINESVEYARIETAGKASY
jgi:hypothetical protein